MANGVRQSTSERADTRNANRSKLLSKKNRKWTILGAAGLGGVLLLSRGNKNASSTQNPNSLQTGPMDPIVAPGGYPAPNASGGDITGGKAPGVVVAVSANGNDHDCPPGWHWDPKKNRCVKDATHGGTPPPHHKPPKGKPLTKNQKARKKALAKPGVTVVSRTGKVLKPPPKPSGSIGPAHPKQASRTTPAPAGKSGKHPATPRKTAGGAKRSSPAVVESVQGIGSGIVVAGREFPGAVSHTMGAPRNIGPGMTGRVVTVNYGSHTERHVLHADGSHWTDNVAGVNPPSRGVPTVRTRAEAR